jgi:hypothetical protein
MAYQFRARPQQQQQSSYWQQLFPQILGGLGSVGGGAIGTAIGGPGVGTTIGAGLGGSLANSAGQQMSGGVPQQMPDYWQQPQRNPQQQQQAVSQMVPEVPAFNNFSLPGAPPQSGGFDYRSMVPPPPTPQGYGPYNPQQGAYGRGMQYPVQSPPQSPWLQRGYA